MTETAPPEDLSGDPPGELPGESALGNQSPNRSSESFGNEERPPEPSGTSIRPLLVRATVLQVLGRVYGSCCTLAYLWLGNRCLSDDGFDRWTFYLAAFMWLDSLAVFGTGSVALQRLGAEPERAGPVLWSVRRIRLVAAGLGVLAVAAAVFGGGEADGIWIVLAALYPLTHCLEVSAAVLKARFAWERPVIVRAIAGTLSLLCVLVLVGLESARPAHFLVAVALGSTLGNFLLHRAARRYLPEEVREPGSPRDWSSILKQAYPLGLSALCAQGYFYVDNLFIRHYAEVGELGRYNVGVRLMSLFIMVAQHASLSALPWYSKRVSGQIVEHNPNPKHSALGLAIGRMGPPLFALGCAGAGLLYPRAEQVLELFGPDFGLAAASFRWLLLAGIAIYAGAVLLTAVVSTGSSWTVLAITATGLLINLIGNFCWVPSQGIVGAARATCATEVAVALLALWALQRRGQAAPISRWLAYGFGALAFWAAQAFSSALPF